MRQAFAVEETAERPEPNLCFTLALAFPGAEQAEHLQSFELPLDGRQRLVDAGADLGRRRFRMVGDVAASWGGVSAIRQGSFGLLPADVATSLAMIISELCQNAVEHGLAHQSGEVRVVPSRYDGRLRMEISDDGRGLPPGFDWRKSRSLGLSIVNTLVAEMEGSFQLGPRLAGSGTQAVVEIPL